MKTTSIDKYLEKISSVHKQEMTKGISNATICAKKEWSITRKRYLTHIRTIWNNNMEKQELGNAELYYEIQPASSHALKTFLIRNDDLPLVVNFYLQAISEFTKNIFANLQANKSIENSQTLLMTFAKRRAIFPVRAAIVHQKKDGELLNVRS